MTRRSPRCLHGLMTALALGLCSLLRVSAGHAQSTPSVEHGFDPVSSVMSSPRCANCHIAGDAPLQGNDGRTHTMNIRRGTDGRGTPAMRCTNCHQEASGSIPHAPPGGPDWHLPAAATPMAWRGLSPGEQCRMLIDRSRNGNRGLPELLEHVTTDGLVIASWSPGPGRSAPPLSHEVFVQRFKEWMESGAHCPE
jgi:hypothetical protein